MPVSHLAKSLARFPWASSLRMPWPRRPDAVSRGLFLGLALPSGPALNGPHLTAEDVKGGIEALDGLWLIHARRLHDIIDNATALQGRLIDPAAGGQCLHHVAEIKRAGARRVWMTL